jgi:hypothetical protein
MEMNLDLDGLRLENRQAQAALTKLALTVEGIHAQVENQKSTLQGVDSRMADLRLDAQGLQLKVDRIQTQGVSRVSTSTGYTFDEGGLLISKDGQTMENLLDNTGMYVRRAGQTILQASDAGVKAVDVQVKNYLILGSHGDKRIDPYSGVLTEPEQLRRYYEYTVEGMESGLFLYLAHPDVMLGRYPAFDDTAADLSRKLCREANRLGMPIEYNMYGVYKGAKEGCLGYPYDGFWRIAAEENCRAVVGVDAHFPEGFRVTPIEPAMEYLRSLGIAVLEDPTKA